MWQPWIAAAERIGLLESLQGTALSWTINGLSLSSNPCVTNRTFAFLLSVPTFFGLKWNFLPIITAFRGIWRTFSTVYMSRFFNPSASIFLLSTKCCVWARSSHGCIIWMTNSSAKIEVFCSLDLSLGRYRSRRRTTLFPWDLDSLLKEFRIFGYWN